MTDEADWKAKLTPEQYRVLREKGTERPFTGELLNSKHQGKFACAACGNMLFSSDTKFDSGTGWPSFEDALPGAVEFHHDNSHWSRWSHCGQAFDRMDPRSYSLSG